MHSTTATAVTIQGSRSSVQPTSEGVLRFTSFLQSLQVLHQPAVEQAQAKSCEIPGLEERLSVKYHRVVL